MKICITGANGLIGRSLISRLITLPSMDVTAFDRTPAPENMPVRWLQGDLQHEDDCARLVNGQDIIFHLAHTNSPLTSDQDMVEDTQLNLIPMLKILKAIERNGRKPHFIYPSSGGAVYGTSAVGDRFTEDERCMPMNSYGIQKLAAEHY
ncbi:MAG: NAD-dependent epimerase/dehydratase family protein, partial [Chlorobiota bacterium]